MPDRAEVAALAALARPSGAFAMLALDQRESLRTMLIEATRKPATDADLTAFKIEAAHALTPQASAVLLDRDYGLWPVLETNAVADGCRLIVAADRLLQAPGGPIEWTEVDEAVLGDPPTVEVADAFKLLVIWRPDREREERRRVVMAFLEGCRRAGKPGIVEAIVRLDGGAPGPDEHARHVVTAAAEIGALGPDLYKAEIPTLGAASDGEIADAAGRLTETLSCPWVVLSNGTPPERFADAAVAACRGGASGFLAGRAIWLRTLGAPDRKRELETTAAEELRELADRVDEVVEARRPST